MVELNNVLILGRTGMLGNCVYKFLTNNKSFTVVTIDDKLRWPSVQFKEAILNTNCDVVINCIGSIPQRSNDFEINFDFPVWLNESLNKKVKIIHPGTDCENDNDYYGISKRNATVYLSSSSERSKIIKTSIIGHELKNHVSLLDWFLRQDAPVSGFKNHMWNGITTLEWAKLCEDLIKNWSVYKPITQVGTECISKYDLLNVMNKVYEKDCEIKPVNHSYDTNKCLVVGIKLPSIETQLRELKAFYEK